jgi:hypothetical protein
MLGGDFKDGFKMALMSSSLRYVYNKVTKFDVDARHGERAASFKDNAGHSLPAAPATIAALIAIDDPTGTHIGPIIHVLTAPAV